MKLDTKQTLSPQAQAKMNAGNSSVRQRYAVGTTAQPKGKPKNV